MPAKTNKSAKTPSDSRVRKLDRKSKKKTVRNTSKIPSGYALLKNSLKTIWQNKKAFGGILFIYLLLNILLVKGLAANFQLNTTRQEIESVLGDELGSLGMGATLFGLLVGSSGTSYGEAGGVYQTLLFVVMSLAVIWVLRQTRGVEKKVSTKQAFYKGMYPIIPYVLVWLVVILQLLPALIGSTLYTVVSANGIAVGIWEQIAWVLVLLISFGVSIYLVCSSIFATYIVTLPDITPIIALRKAKKLLKYRRALVLRKFLFLPLILLLAMVVIFLPLVLYATIIAEVIFMIFSLIAFVVAHAYMYELYRELME